MKLRAIIFFSLIGIFGETPTASAQSLKGLFKSAVNKVKQEVKQEVNNTTSKTKSAGTSSVKGKLPAMNNSSSSLFGANHTALFAPVGTTINAKYGIKKVTPVKPPKEDVKQPDWNDARTYIYELDNQSLVDEYLMLKKCMETKYINPTGPASFRYHSVLDELVERTSRLNRMVEYYNEANDAANDEDEVAFADEFIDLLIGQVLKQDSYKRMVRSSLAPFATLNKLSGKNFMENETMDYFEKHGGLQNAHKANFTVVKSRKKR